MEDQKKYLPTRQENSMTLTDPAAIAAAETAKAEVQAMYQMALYNRRNEAEARDRIINHCKRLNFAKRVEYAKPVGNRKIKGPSIRFAEMAMDEWQNIFTRSRVVYEDEHIRKIAVSCTDLERNVTHQGEITLKKTVERKSKKGREVVGERQNTYGETVYIVKATEDELHNKTQANISKIKRNEGLRIIPTDIIDDALDVARRTIAEGIDKDPKGERKKILDAFSAIGVSPKEVERYLNHPISTISPSEIIDLRSVYQTIKDGEATWQDYVSDTKTSPAEMEEKILNGESDKEEKAYVCPHKGCGYTTKSERGLKSHITKVHPPEVIKKDRISEEKVLLNGEDSPEPTPPPSEPERMVTKDQLDYLRNVMKGEWAEEFVVWYGKNPKNMTEAEAQELINNFDDEYEKFMERE